MSVKVHRSTNFSYLVNTTIQLDGVTLEKLAPGESTTFELPDQSDSMTVKAYFSKKEIQVSNGDEIDIVRNTRMLILKIAAHIFIPLVGLLIIFGLIESPIVATALLMFGLISYIYTYYFVPDFDLIKQGSPSE